MNFIIEVLSSSVISSILCVLIIWIMRTWISEKLKASINSEYNKKLESFRNELRSKSEEHQIKLKKLYDMRAQPIVELFTMIQKLGDTATSVIACIKGKPILNRPERLVTLNSVINEFKSFYKLNRIYFAKRICNKIDDLCDECEDVLQKLQNKESEPIEEINGILVDICDKIKNKIPEISNELEAEFRKLLGVEEEKLL